jgi:hypothetical protein
MTPNLLFLNGGSQNDEKYFKLESEKNKKIDQKCNNKKKIEKY